jgi:hypothetical protein
MDEQREEKPLERGHEHSHLAQVTEKTPEQGILIADAAKKHFLFTQVIHIHIHTTHDFIYIRIHKGARPLIRRSENK